MTLDLARIVTTRGAIDALRKYADTQGLAPQDITVPLLERFKNCDWGNISDEDKAINNNSSQNGNMILGEYLLDDVQLWMISDPCYRDTPESEPVRHVTTILLPSEY